MSSSSPRRLVKRSELVIMAMFLMNPGSDSWSGSDMAPAAPAPGGKEGAAAQQWVAAAVRRSSCAAMETKLS